MKYDDLTDDERIIIGSLVYQAYLDIFQQITMHFFTPDEMVDYIYLNYGMNQQNYHGIVLNAPPDEMEAEWFTMRFEKTYFSLFISGDVQFRKVITLYELDSCCRYYLRSCIDTEEIVEFVMDMRLL